MSTHETSAGSPRRSPRREVGFTLIEVLFGIVTLAVATTAIMQGVAMSTLAVGEAEDSAVAIEYARSLAERVSATPIDEVVGIWGPDGTEGPTFRVESLDGKKAGAGTIRIVTDETETDRDLKASFGLPRDLDGDGLMTSTDVSLTARVLPVLIEVHWGRRADQRIRIPVIVVR